MNWSLLALNSYQFMLEVIEIPMQSSDRNNRSDERKRDNFRRNSIIIMKKANNKTNIVVNVPVFVKVLKMTKKV